jgi:hypothetical protein
MAEKKRKKSELVTNLAPKAFTVAINGDDVLVPANKDENAIMNMIVAARMRHLLQQTMDSYKDDGVKLTPKEMRDLAAAGRDIAAFSAEVYPNEPVNERPNEVAQADDINFEELHTSPPNEPSNPPEA